MSYEITGTLIVKNEIQQITEKFKKREFVLEKIEQSKGNEFIENIKFQMIQDNCSKLDSFNIGDEIKVSFNIKGRKWEKDGKTNYFNNLDAWKVEMNGNRSETTDSESNDDEPSDDLPF